MAVQDELDAILARLQRMREEIQLDVPGGWGSGDVSSSDRSRIPDESGADLPRESEGRVRPLHGAHDES